LDQLTPEHRRILIDVLSFCLSRTGLVNPILGQSTYREVGTLAGRAGVILVPDTNALFNGTLHWLLRTFHNTRLDIAFRRIDHTIAAAGCAIKIAGRKKK
jgi:hypothetical protein